MEENYVRLKHMNKPIKKILIANRGDTAIRIIHACKELGFQTVAVHSTADNDALHVKLADESVCIGDGPSSMSYLDMKAILAAAEITGAQAIHPGIGFLSENDQFAAMVEDHNLCFIGPTAKNINEFGSKITARKIMHENGFPIIPGTIEPVNSVEEALEAVKKIGYPFVFKGAWCGGGKGIRIVKNESELSEGFMMAAAEAKKFSNRLDLYMERYIGSARHIEIQICADHYGNVVHFFERDCSIQRNHQKVWEEAPSTALTQEQRMEIGAKVCQVMKKVGYRSLGTVELLYDQDSKEYFFMEVNTRLQVEHTITEEVTQFDLVREQILVSMGAKLSVQQNDLILKGHAIECRINAEDPVTFQPSPLQLSYYLAPTGRGVRIESGAFTGYQIPIFYDSLLSKLIVYDRTRELALIKMKNALKEYIIKGPKTNIPLHLKLVDNLDIINGNFNTTWLTELLAKS